jgi:hypothetical protein
MIVELAALQPHDLAAILGELDQRQRTSVERLLQDFLGFGLGDPEPPQREKSFDRSRFSPWLLQRLEEEDGAVRLSDATRAALRVCAGDLYPISAARRPNGKQSGLFGRRKPAHEGAAA